MEKGTNGKQVGNSNVVKLKAWLDQVDWIPEHGGRVDKSRLAVLAGFKDRQPFYNNSGVKDLLEKALKTHRLVNMPDEANKGESEKTKLERKVADLQLKNDNATAENFELKRKLKRLKHIERVIEKGRRVIP